MPAADDFELFSRDGRLWDHQGQPVVLKGVNWFGLETSDFCLHGLWCRPMDTLLDFVASNGFNAIRVPFSTELALNMDERRPGNIDAKANPDLAGLTSGQVMDELVRRCAARGILILLDSHRLAAAGDIPELWYSDEYPEEAVLRAWRTIVLRYQGCFNVVGADLKNEPHGRAEWGTGNVATDWRLAAERIAVAVLDANPKLLCFVEGVASGAVVQPPEACWWGGHVAALAAAPVRLPKPDKLVVAIHVYGPDVHKQDYFAGGADAMRARMPDIWMRHFGFVVRDKLGPAVVPGEWGGFAREGSDDRAWQEQIADWFRDNGVESSFYWCLNPNSGDTGGLLDDAWEKPMDHKLAIVARAHPAPTRFPCGDVAISAPPPEACAVTGAINPATAAPAAPAAAAQPAAVANGSCGAAATGPPAPLAAGTCELKRCSNWLDANRQAFQSELVVVNTGGAPATSMRLRVRGGELQKCWNATRLHDDGAHWVFDFPDWVGPAGGLAPGASVAVGLITLDAEPSEFALEL